MTARAVQTKTGWLLNGLKWFCTNGGLADIYVVGFKTDPDAYAKGISMFIIEKGKFRIQYWRDGTKNGVQELNDYWFELQGLHN